MPTLFQSGCRPDLVSYHKQEKTSHSDEHRASPENYPRNYRDARSTGALPKRNKFNQNDHEVAQGPIFFRQKPPEEVKQNLMGINSHFFY